MQDCSNGPVSSMPGSKHRVEPGATCTNHENAPAVEKVQTETDRYGAEYFYACEACKIIRDKSLHELNPGVCDWCNDKSNHLVKRRDPDEGTSGRVYNVCSECIVKQNKKLEEERIEHIKENGGYIRDDSDDNYPIDPADPDFFFDDNPDEISEEEIIED
jgi:hypothetical protein